MAQPTDTRAIHQAVHAAGINTPYWCRVVGDRLEIQPLGGKVITFPYPLPAQPVPTSQITVTGDLSAAKRPELGVMKRDELRALARKLQIAGQGSMTKAQLIEAIGAV